MSNKKDYIEAVYEIQPLHELTDLGNADRFNEALEGKNVFVSEMKTWFFWDGFVWKIDEQFETDKIIRKVLVSLDQDIQTYKILLGKLRAFKTDEEDEELDRAIKYAVKKVGEIENWRRSSQMKGHIDACIRLASSQGAKVISYSEFDSKGHFIGVQNGAFNLDKYKLVVGDPDYLITKRVRTKYDPDATCENWEKFIEQVTGGNKENAKFLQRIAGQALLGHKKNKLFVFVGPGGGGKSTFADVIGHVLGDYFKTTDTKTILSDAANKEYYLSDLKGARLVTMNETSENAYLARDLVKKILDSGEVTARDPRGKPFQYQPVFTPILTTNHIPTMGADDAVWRRVIIVKFDQIIPEGNRETDFAVRMLHPEASGILNWCIEGLKMWRQVGLAVPKDVADATMEERMDQDRVQQFLNSWFMDCDGESYPLKDMYALYTHWCRDQGIKYVETNRTLAKDLRSKGYDVSNSTKHLNQTHVFGVIPRVTQINGIDINLFLAQQGLNVKTGPVAVRRKSGLVE